MDLYTPMRSLGQGKEGFGSGLHSSIVPYARAYVGWRQKNKKGLNAPFMRLFLCSPVPSPSSLQELLTNGIFIILYYRLSLPTLYKWYS